MLKNFLNLQPAISAVIATSESKSFKKYRNILLLSEKELEYIRKCLQIFDIFIKATTKLQAEKYPTIYYLIPKVYKIYTKLEKVKASLNEVSTFSYN